MNSNARTARLGVNAVERIVVRDLLWIFREQTIEDYGIDAHIEICEGGQATGRLIAAQIKAGDTYFRRTSSKGFIFVGAERHLRYWTSHSLPVVLILYNPHTDAAWWVPIESDRITLNGDAWSIVVPFESRLEAGAAPALEALALPDYRKRKELRASIRILFSERGAARTSPGVGALLGPLQAAAASIDLAFPRVDMALIWAMKTLSLRVPVRLVTTSATTGDITPELRYASDETPGFQVRIYSPDGKPAQFYAKYVLVDDTIAIYGSANLTARSWRDKFEKVLAADDVGVVKQLREDYERLWALSLPLSPKM